MKREFAFLISQGKVKEAEKGVAKNFLRVFTNVVNICPPTLI